MAKSSLGLDGLEAGPPAESMVYSRGLESQEEGRESDCSLRTTHRREPRLSRSH
jgi:hypothetical protein